MAKRDASRDLGGYPIRVEDVRLFQRPSAPGGAINRLIHILRGADVYLRCFLVELGDLTQEEWSAEVMIETRLIGSTAPGNCGKIFPRLFGGLEWTTREACAEAMTSAPSNVYVAQLDDQISKVCSSMQIPAEALGLVPDPLDDPRKRAAYYGIAPEAEHAPPALRCCSMCKGSGGDERGNCPACRGVGLLSPRDADMVKALLDGGSLDSPEVAEALARVGTVTGGAARPGKTARMKNEEGAFQAYRREYLGTWSR